MPATAKRRLIHLLPWIGLLMVAAFAAPSPEADTTCIRASTARDSRVARGTVPTGVRIEASEIDTPEHSVCWKSPCGQKTGTAVDEIRLHVPAGTETVRCGLTEWERPRGRIAGSVRGRAPPWAR